jgi:hypothetical protein
MNLDILINSCARPDVLQKSIITFKKYIKSKHKFRYIILEDKVEDIKRQELGRTWIEKNSNLFDEIHYSYKKMGPGFFFAPIVKLCQTPYFFHLEDDNEFIFDIDIDPILEVMMRYENIAAITLRRRSWVDPRNNPVDVTIDGMELTRSDIYSVATGLFNTSVAKCIIDKAGWNNQLREVQVLGKISSYMNFEKYTLGHNNTGIHYKHVGPKNGYNKGSWKN